MKTAHRVFLLALIAAADAAVAEDWLYTVRPGDTLWGLARTHLHPQYTHDDLARHNAISVPRHMPPGTRLRIPTTWLKSTAEAARVIAVIGAARYSGGTAPRVDDRIETGSAIVTGPDGRVTVQFVDGAQVTIGPDSEVGFAEISSSSSTGSVDTRLDLRRGRVESLVRPPPGVDSRYRIDTPAAVAAVRGTRFRVQADAGTMSNETLDGTVAVAGAGVEQLVGAGFGTRAVAGEPPAAPRRLLSAPELSTATTVRGSQAVLEWQPLAGAESYRVELARTAWPAGIHTDLMTPATRLEVLALQTGEYDLRVRGVDDIGLNGFDATTRIHVIDGWPVPTLSPPAMDRHQLWIGWSPVVFAPYYEFELARDPQFVERIVHVVQSGTGWTLPRPEPGTYYARVRVHQAYAADGTYGPAQSIAVPPLGWVDQLLRWAEGPPP
ncbi:MAG: FecR domain-containing protein [Chromatiales bacterium]|nr:FecR domain-containing protein [Chromatiales bacterium]